jgi:Na+-driven multidrug efflux pump
MWGISVVFTWILGIFFHLGIVGAWIAMAADEIFRGIVVFIRWIVGSWRGKSVVEKDTENQ